MSLDERTTSPSLEQLKTCAAFLQQGLFEPETGTRGRSIKICPDCILAHALVVVRTSHASPEEIPKRPFLTDCREFLVDAMWLLTTLPTLEDERKIWPDLRRAYNTCPNHNERRYWTDQGLLSRLVLSLVSIISQCFILAIKKLSAHSEIRFGTKGMWPTAVKDVLPGDSPRRAMSNLILCWSRYSENQIFTRALHGVFLQLRSIPRDIAAALMDTRQVFLPAYLERTATVGRIMQQSPANCPAFDEAQGELYALTILGFGVVQTINTAKLSPHELVAGHEDQLSASLDEAARGESLLPQAPEIRIGTIHGFLLANHHDPPQLVTQPRQISSSIGGLRLRKDPYMTFYTVAISGSRESRCWARGCQQYGEPEASKLRHCARCRAVRYCSRQCQRVHWKDEKRPHKAVCAVLARIQDSYPFYTGEPDAKAFSLACRNAGIQVEDLVRPYHHFLAIRMVDDLSDAEGLERSRLSLLVTQEDSVGENFK